MSIGHDSWTSSSCLIIPSDLPTKSPSLLPGCPCVPRHASTLVREPPRMTPLPGPSSPIGKGLSSSRDLQRLQEQRCCYFCHTVGHAESTCVPLVGTGALRHASRHFTRSSSYMASWAMALRPRNLDWTPHKRAGMRACAWGRAFVLVSGCPSWPLPTITTPLCPTGTNSCSPLFTDGWPSRLAVQCGLVVHDRLI